MAAPTEIALFAGAGGGVIASRMLGHRIVCYVEREPFCVEVLKARIADGSIDDAPIWDDVRTFDGRPWRGLVDIVSGGFPCQPFSNAGNQRGADDERNCWPDVLRLVREIRPGVVFLENVAALVATDYFGTVLGDLAASGYDARWDCIPASAVGAPHARDRLWLVAHPSGPRQPHVAGRQEGAERHGVGASRDGRGLGGVRISWPPDPASGPVESRVGRVAHGLARGLDRDRAARLKALGNGQVPQAAVAAWRLLGGDDL